MSYCRFENFFGLRDFIHFINYIRRNRQGSVNASIVLRSLERNFNGNGREDFERICSIFLEKVRYYCIVTNSRKCFFIIYNEIELCN